MKTAVQIAQEIKKHKPIDKTNVMYDETWEDYMRGRRMTREEAIDYLTILGGIEGITANEAMALEIAIEALEEEPQIRPKGHWIMTHDYFTGAYESIDYVECSCCHADSLEEGNYCPNCGAEMSEDKE